MFVGLTYARQVQEARGGREGVEPAGGCQPNSQVHSGLTKLLRSRKERGRCPVLRLIPGHRALGLGWKSAVCLQVREPVTWGWQEGWLGPSIPRVLQAGGRRRFRVWLKAWGSKG